MLEPERDLQSPITLCELMDLEENEFDNAISELSVYGEADPPGTF